MNATKLPHRPPPTAYFFIAYTGTKLLLVLYIYIYLRNYRKEKVAEIYNF